LLARHEFELVLETLASLDGNMPPSLYLGDPARNAGELQSG
jgi:hypothetical protein